MEYYTAINMMSYWYTKQDESQEHIKWKKLDTPKMYYSEARHTDVLVKDRLLAYTMVVPYNYNGAKKVLSPSDMLVILIS